MIINNEMYSDSNLFESILFFPSEENRRIEGGLRTKGIIKNSTKDKPLVTIITAVFNGEKYIEETIKSILEQDYKNVEYIIIDGCSNDKTVEIIKQYDDQIDYWCSESDSGIYNAWNKGLQLAQGDLIGFLSAGDLYNHKSIESVVLFFSHTSECILYGKTQKFNENGCTVLNSKIFDEKKILNGFGFMHPSVFTTRNVYKKVGLFNENYTIAGDTDWLIRAFKINIPFHHNNHTVYMMEGGISQVFQKRALNEFYTSLQNHGYDEHSITKTKFIKNLKFIIKKITFHKTLQSYKRAARFYLVYLYSGVYKYIPTFTLKKIFLTATNIKLGKSTYIHTPVLFFNFKGNITIGNNTTINSKCYLDNRGKITIGNNVSIAHNTKIYTAGHDVQSYCFNLTKKDVLIDDNVCIFANVLIMPGVHVREGAVIYPGSVVTTNVEPYTIIGGNPAKFIKKRNKLLLYKLDYNVWFAI